MTTATVQTAAVLKRQYKNNTGGWLGVVIISPKGDELGTNIEPYGTIWLSDEEAILTSRAPRRPEDNPFEEQMFVMQDDTGRKFNVPMRPLELLGDGERYVPANDRFVPGGINDAHAAALAESGARGGEPANFTTELHAVAAKAATVVGPHPQQPAPRLTDPVREPPAVPRSSGSAGEGAPSAPAPAAPPLAPVPAVRSEPAPRAPVAPTAAIQGTAAPATQEEEEVRQSWVQAPVAPGLVLQGTLGGDDTPLPAPAVVPPAPASAQLASTPIQQAPITRPVAAEERAAVDPEVGEEVGQATPPAPRTEGEYAHAEEVGTPGLLGDEE